MTDINLAPLWIDSTPFIFLKTKSTLWSSFKFLPPYLAENIPGSPFKQSITKPESSEIVGILDIS